MSVPGLVLVGQDMALLPHAQALSSLSDPCRVTGAWSGSRDRREAAASTHGLPDEPDLDALVADPQVDADTMSATSARVMRVAELLEKLIR